MTESLSITNSAVVIHGYVKTHPKTLWLKHFILLMVLWIRNLGSVWLDSSCLGSLLYFLAGAGLCLSEDFNGLYVQMDHSQGWPLSWSSGGAVNLSTSIWLLPVALAEFQEGMFWERIFQEIWMQVAKFLKSEPWKSQMSLCWILIAHIQWVSL